MRTKFVDTHFGKCGKCLLIGAEIGFPSAEEGG
jgi:hypothetical protein